MQDPNEWERRLRYLLQLADQVPQETIDGLGLAEDVKRAQEEREARIEMAAELLEPLGIDLRQVLQKEGYLPARGARAQRKRGKRESRPRVIQISEAEEPYRGVARKALKRAPEGGRVSFELYGRRYVMILQRGDQRLHVVCRYYNRKPGHTNWWFTASDQDLKDTDYFCFILCDEHGNLQDVAIAATPWLNANKHHLARCEDRGYHVYIYEVGDGFEIRRGEWREPLQSGPDVWNTLWQAVGP